MATKSKSMRCGFAQAYHRIRHLRYIKSLLCTSNANILFQYITIFLSGFFFRFAIVYVCTNIVSNIFRCGCLNGYLRLSLKLSGKLKMLLLYDINDIDGWNSIVSYTFNVSYNRKKKKINWFNRKVTRCVFFSFAEKIVYFAPLFWEE